MIYLDDASRARLRSDLVQFYGDTIGTMIRPSGAQ